MKTFILWLILASTAIAQTKVFVPIDQTYGLLITSASAIDIEKVPIKNLDIKPQPPASTLSQKVSQIADVANEPEIRKKLATVYLGVARQADQFPSQEKLESTLKTLVDLVINTSKNPSAWEPLRTLVNKEITARAQEGGGYVDILEDVSSGLGPTEALDLQKIVQIIQIILTTDNLLEALPQIILLLAGI